MDSGKNFRGPYTHYSEWRSPSNIALIKYWGKAGRQIPANPSISFTLNEAYTQTRLSYSKDPEGKTSLEFYFDGVENSFFAARIQKYLQEISRELPFLAGAFLKIESTNSFPHSAGIASSASSMSALALCFCSLEQQLTGTEMRDPDFFRRASWFARLGSGSACRSVYGGMAVWGHHENVTGSSDLYAVPLTFHIHPLFRDFHDTILIVDSKPKEVSSTFGHQLMDHNPFAQERYQQANRNLKLLLPALRDGDISLFTEIVENEAMTLHGLMLCSKPYFSLLKENTLRIIKKIQAFREQNGINLCFTLDAGPNVHLLYPSAVKEAVSDFIENELKDLCENGKYMTDHVGEGPVELTDNGNEE